MNRRTEDAIFITFIGTLVLALVGAIGFVVWYYGYETASMEWCAHVGGTFIDHRCYQGDVSPVDLGSGQN